MNNINDTVLMTNKNQLLEYVKCQLRTETMIFSFTRSKQMRERENFLVKKHEDLEAKLDKKIVSETPKYYKYIKTKGEWENIVKKDNGIILRSKAKWMEKKKQNIS